MAGDIVGAIAMAVVITGISATTTMTITMAVVAAGIMEAVGLAISPRSMMTTFY